MIDSMRGRMRHAGAAISLLLGLAATGCGHSAASAAAAASPAPTPSSFAFQPITIQRIDLPASISGARWPGFTTDGQHLLFWSAGEMWITDLHGNGVQCLSCGLANDPGIDSGALSLATMATPFPDGKRVLIEEDAQLLSTGMVVLECEPSVIDCQSRRLVPVDYAAAESIVILPGGAASLPQIGLPHVAAHAQLSPDGHYVGFSQARSDSVEAMIVGKLDKHGARYLVSDPRVINPAGPVSAADSDVGAWSNSSSLFEFKTFTNGGADATYAQVGGPHVMATNIWSVNLATGQRTQLTAALDWNEDNGMSPDGTLLSAYSQRTMHYIDWIEGLVPARDFIDAPASVASAGLLGGWTACMGPMWLLPPSGDDGGRLAGQPIVDYSYPGVHVVDTLAEASQWSPDSTMIALNTIDDTTGQPAPFLLVAHLSARQPSQPLPAVSSQPGAWAPAPADYHGALGHNGSVTLKGPGGGSVRLDYQGTPGALAGAWSETYQNYSDDGASFINGSVSIAAVVEGGGSYSAHLNMTGAHSGNTDADLTFGSNGTSGSSVSTYDGNTITGPTPQASGKNVNGGPQTACPDDLPKKPALQATATNLGKGQYRIAVTASVAGVGPNEALVDTRPVWHASLTLGSTTSYTDEHGLGLVTDDGSHALAVSAGDTLEPTSVHLQ